MIAAVAGVAASCAWATSALCASRASAVIGAWAAVGWMMVAGLVVCLPLVALGSGPDTGGDHLAWFAVSGLCNVLGLVALYTSMASLDVSIAVAISAGGAALAALLGIATGSPGTVLMVAGIVVVVAGIILAAPRPEDGPRLQSSRGYLLACAAAIFFSLSIFAINRLADTQSIGWAVIWPRVFGVALIAVPLALQGRMPLQRSVVPFVIGAGVAEVAGFIALALGSREWLVMADVFAGQYPVITAIAAFVLLGERLDTRQRKAIALVALGVAVVALGAQ